MSSLTYLCRAAAAGWCPRGGFPRCGPARPVAAFSVPALVKHSANTGYSEISTGYFKVIK